MVYENKKHTLTTMTYYAICVLLFSVSRKTEIRPSVRSCWSAEWLCRISSFSCVTSVKFYNWSDSIPRWWETLCICRGGYLCEKIVSVHKIICIEKQLYEKNWWKCNQMYFHVCPCLCQPFSVYLFYTNRRE
jgi:hypothetical protein